MDGRWPADVTALTLDGAGGTAPLACGAIAWRYGGALRLTIVAKATFDLVHDQPLRLRQPEELLPRDVHLDGDPQKSVHDEADLAPYRPHADVTFVGHAYPPNAQAPGVTVRLALYRETAIIDRTLHVYGDRDAAGNVARFQRMPLVHERAPLTADNPVGSMAPNAVDARGAMHGGAFAPISRWWPPRARVLHGRPPSGETFLELPNDVDWTYFQAAPIDQQTTFLRGDEWIVLDGVHPALPRVKTQLPSIRARAVIHSTGQAQRGLALEADSLAIDGDRMVARVAFRASLAVENEHALRAMKILVGLEIAGREIRWPTPDALAHAQAPRSAYPVAAAVPFVAPQPGAPPLGGIPSIAHTDEDPEAGGTSVYSPAQAAAMRARPLVPFVTATKAAPKFEEDSTFSLGEEESRALLQRAAPTFGAPAAPAPSTPPAAPTFGGLPRIAMDEDEDFQGTVNLTKEQLQRLATAKASPFVAAKPGDPPPVFSLPKLHTEDPDDDASGTSVLSRADVLAAAAAAKPLPFGNRGTGPASAPPAAPPPTAPPGSVGRPPIFDPPSFGPSSFKPAQLATPPAPPPPAPPPLAPPMMAPLPVVSPMMAPPPIAPPPIAPPPMAPSAMAPVVAPPTMGAPIMPPVATPIAQPAVAPAPQAAPPVGARGAPVSREIKPKPRPPEPPAPTVVTGPDSEARKRATDKLAKRASFDGDDFSGADLSGLDFSSCSLIKCKLRGANLRGATLRGAQLEEADLEGAALEDADLGRADLSRANLSKARLDRAKLVDTKFAAANGAGASFRKATGQRTGFAKGNWTDAVFDDAELSAPDFTSATLDKTSFRGTTLEDARLGDAHANGAVLDEARLVKARGKGSSWTGCSFECADLGEVAFGKTLLKGSSFAGANMKGANLAEADCEGCAFTSANLSDADLDDAGLAGARLEFANLEGARLRKARGERADFQDANLAGADFRNAKFPRASFVSASLKGVRADGADLQSCRFMYADLSSANLRGATLSSAILAHAKLDAADLRNADLEGANVHGTSRATAKLTGAKTAGMVESPPDLAS